MGHILRMGPERDLKKVIFVLWKEKREGCMLMDAPKTDSWRELTTYVCNREWWRERVRSMKQPRVVEVSLGPHITAGYDVPFTISS